jgi:hypothetical protein
LIFELTNIQEYLIVGNKIIVTIVSNISNKNIIMNVSCALVTY